MTTWRKASRCGSAACVEVALTPEGVAVRDGKAPHRGALYFTAEEWRVFLAAAREGEFDV